MEDPKALGEKFCLLTPRVLLMLAFGAGIYLIGCVSQDSILKEEISELHQQQGIVYTPKERTVDVIYRFTIREIPQDAKTIAVWLPFPATNEHQEVRSFHIEGGVFYKIVEEEEYGNRFIHLTFSKAVFEEKGEIEVSVTFNINRKSYRMEDKAEASKLPSESDVARFLASDRLIPVDGKIAAEAQRVTRGIRGKMAQARQLYEHLTKTMVYDKSGKGWGRGNALYACEVRAGNCTDFHSLFIGEARSLGIPARFIMGLPLTEGDGEGEITGYHCWAEFYLKGKGWIPVDVSEAAKFPAKKEALFGGLDAHRIQFTVGRDITIPGASSGPLNFAIYPHVEINEKTHLAVETRFFFRESGDLKVAAFMRNGL